MKFAHSSDTSLLSSLAFTAPATGPAPAGVPSAEPVQGVTLHPSVFPGFLTTSGRGGPAHLSPLERFNTAPAHTAEAALLTCCRSRRWAERLAAHRPYPDLDSLLAAADEASYDLSVAEVADALACEVPPRPAADTPPAAHTALRAALAAYESRFGHAFVICLDGFAPGEQLDQVLAGIRFRLGNERDEERAVAAEELRRLARGRLARTVQEVRNDHEGLAAGPDSPSVAV